MAIKDLKAVLLETLLSPDSSPEEKQAAADGIAKLETAAKPAQKSPIEDTSTSDRYFREADAQIKEHLAAESKHPEAIDNLVKAEHMLFDAVRHHLQAADPNGSSLSHQEQLWPTIIEWWSNPLSTPAEPIIGFMKETKAYLVAVGVTWPVTSVDMYFEEFKEKES